MREIKFRGKRTDNGKWEYGQYYFSGYAHWICEFHDIPPSPSDPSGYCIFIQNKIDPNTLGQYTGLNDKKITDKFPDGEPIYEGDIVSYINREWATNIKREVIFVDGFFSIGLYWKEADHYHNDYSMSHYEKELLEIIGNITENPELLN